MLKPPKFFNKYHVKITLVVLVAISSIYYLPLFPLIYAPDSNYTKKVPLTINTSSSSLLNLTGQGLINLHTVMPNGWAWESSIQSPHFQTDRDVGTAGVAMGLLALWQETNNQEYLDAASKSRDWLISVAQPSNGGIMWPDYSDPNDVSNTNFTSFDDGTPGISDILW